MKNSKTKLFTFFVSSFFLFGLTGITEVKALDIIPGLKGFGTDTRAAYGAINPPEICIVDSLLTTTGNPSWNSSGYSVGVFKGTLIQCLEGLNTLNGETIDGHIVKPNSGKIVLFEVSGTIRQIADADNDETFRYKIGSYTTMAGQTSPNPGILFRNIAIFGGGVNDVLIQHVRGRMDGPPSTNHGLHRSIAFASGLGETYNIVIDHSSTAWGADTQIDLYYSGGDLRDITVSNCIISESRENMGLTDEEANNGKNLLIGGHNVNVGDFLVYGNLLSNSKKRNPAIFQANATVANNYLYNNSKLGVQMVAKDAATKLSLIGNVVDGGPMSTGITTYNQLVTLGFNPWQIPVSQNKLYLYDNKTELGTQIDSFDWSMVQLLSINTTAYGNEDQFKVTGENPPTDAPVWPTGLNLMSSSEVKNYIIANAGAYSTFRDSLDTRFINEMMTGTGPSSTVQGPPAPGDWPVLAEKSITLAIPSNPHADNDSDGYTNLEEWLHGLAAVVEGITPPTPCPGGNCCSSVESCLGGTFINSSDCGFQCCTGTCTATATPPTPDPTCADLGICCPAGQLCSGIGKNLPGCENVCCTGGTCIDPPASPVCQNKGYQCCNSCKLDPQPDYDGTCPGGEVCCALCVYAPPPPLGEVGPRNPLKTSDFSKMAENILLWSLSIIGSLALLVIIFGGVMYIGSAGDEQKAFTAKKIITFAIFGLMVILGAYAIVKALSEVVG